MVRVLGPFSLYIAACVYVSCRNNALNALYVYVTQQYSEQIVNQVFYFNNVNTHT